jgi:prolyl oligopeptidase
MLNSWLSDRKFHALGLCVALLSFCCPNAKAEDLPPKALPRPVTETYFGTSVVDPYRWLENTSDAKTSDWFKGQNDYTRKVLERIPSRDKLLQRISALDNAGVSIGGVQVAGGRTFYFKTVPGSDNRRLYVRTGIDGKERLLVDPQKLTLGSKHYSIDYFYPSFDGRLVAYGLSLSGSENSVLHTIDAGNGKVGSEQIDRSQFASVAWRPDGRSFFYTRLPKLPIGAPATEQYRRAIVYLHRVGTDPKQDRSVFGYGVSPRLSIGVDDFPAVQVSPVSPYAFGILQNGVQNELTIYTAPLNALEKSNIPWRKVASVTDAVTRIDVRGEEVYLLSHKDAPRYKILRTSAVQPDIAHATAVVPTSERVITSLGVASDGLYVQDLDGGISRLRRIDFAQGAIKPVALPFEGSIGALVTDGRLPGALLRLESWTKSPLWYAYNPQQESLSDTQLVPASPVDFSDIESVEVKAKSADGTMIPLSIVYKRGLVLDGSHPTWLEGYGAYGITIDPDFRPTRRAWLENGGILAFSHIRGGGEYGEDWHLAGQKLTKQNTIADFIACAEYLVAQKYTSPAHLAGEGTSAGGITIGGAITQRPDLFGAALIRVGESNALRSELMASGPANIPEFGTFKTQDGFKALFAMDAYQHVKDGTPYPAVLLTTGINDPRVAPWQAAKMTARLQAASSSNKPVLLRVDYDAGHGLGSTKSQRDAELADEEAFLFWQLGVREFQPSTP